jgi:hypothetical protein
MKTTALILIFLPDSPTKARWATEEEKVKFVERVRDNDQGIQAKRWKSSHLKEALTDPLAWLLIVMILFQTLVNGGIYTFNALLINKAFGFDPATAQLLGIPLNAFTVMLYFLIGWLVTKTGQTIYCIIGALFVCLIGTVVLITVTPSNSTRGGLLFAFYLMQCIQAINPSCYSLLSRNIAGQTKKSIVYALFCKLPPKGFLNPYVSADFLPQSLHGRAATLPVPSSSNRSGRRVTSTLCTSTSACTLP